MEDFQVLLVEVAMAIGFLFLFQFIFRGYIINSIMCIGFAIAAFVLAFYIESNGNVNSITAWVCTVVSVSFLFGYIERYKDGTYDVDVDYNSWTDKVTSHVSEHESGGCGAFFGVLIGSGIVFAIIYFLLGMGEGWHWVFYVNPVLIIVIKIIGIIKYVRNDF